jgi:hypothetical protein
MSSLGQNDTDKDDADNKLKQAVPWVSDPERRDDEARRLQEDVIAAAMRLERESGRLTQAEPRNAVGFRLLTSEGKPNSEEAARKFWSQLKPEYMSPPPRDGMGLPSIAMAAGFLSAMAVSAIVALVVVNVVHQPTISADVSREERAAKGNSFAATTLGDFTKISEAHAKMKASDEPFPAEPLPSAAVPSALAAAKSPEPEPQEFAKIESRPEIAAPSQTAAPIATAAPPAPAVPEPRPSNSLPPDEISSLLKRGQDLIGAGDIASARLVLTHVADAGSADAAFILAGTFDPTVLASMRAVGVQGDSAKARAWYTRAAELGSLEARQHLQALR